MIMSDNDSDNGNNTDSDMYLSWNLPMSYF